MLNIAGSIVKGTTSVASSVGSTMGSSMSSVANGVKRISTLGRERTGPDLAEGTEEFIMQNAREKTTFVLKVSGCCWKFAMCCKNCDLLLLCRSCAEHSSQRCADYICFVFETGLFDEAQRARSLAEALRVYSTSFIPLLFRERNSRFPSRGDRPAAVPRRDHRRQWSQHHETIHSRRLGAEVSRRRHVALIKCKWIEDIDFPLRGAAGHISLNRMTTTPSPSGLATCCETGYSRVNNTSLSLSTLLE